MRATTMKEEVLRKYPNKNFVETGTADGDGALLASSIFDCVYSIEIDSKMQERNRNRLMQQIVEGKIILITGDSGLSLQKLIPALTEPTTFWLDAHFEKRQESMRSWCPLYEELEIIGKSPIKNHTIMIDDMRVVGRSLWGKKVIRNEIINRIMAINKDYRIVYEDNTMAENDVMVGVI